MDYSYVMTFVHEPQISVDLMDKERRQRMIYVLR